MSTTNVPLVAFLKDLMRRRKRLPSQLGKDLDVSHATVSRWLSSKDIPNIKSCQKLAEYSGAPLEKILFLAGHLTQISQKGPPAWPEFREYALTKYSNEMDEDIITMIEDLIERRRGRDYGSKRSNPDKV